MNRFMQEQWPIFAETHARRTELLNRLSNADLSFSPGGQNITLGALIREMGEVETAYIESLTTRVQNFDYRNTEPGLDTDLTRLKAWFLSLDRQMQTMLEAMSDEDIARKIRRVNGAVVATDVQIHIYMQAALIFFGKAAVYLRAMNRPLPDSVQEWIG